MTSNKRNHVEIESKTTLTLKKGSQALQVHDPTKGLLSKFYDNLVLLASLLPDDVLREDDDVKFRTLLETTLVGSIESLKLVLEPDVVEISMKEIMGRIQGRLFNLHAKDLLANKPEPGMYLNHTPPNILTLGYRRADDRMPVHNIGSHGVAFYSHSVNTIISQINSSAEWQTLLNRIGPGPFFALFGTPTNAIFTSLPNDCFLQISGKPLCDMKAKVPNSITTRRRRPGISKSTLPPSTIADPAPNVQVKKKRKRIRKHSKGNLEASQEDLASESEPESELQESILEDLPPPLKKNRLRKSFSAPQLDLRYTFTRQPLRPTQSVALLIGKRKLELSEEILAVKKPKLEVEVDATIKPNEVVFARNKMYHARPTKTPTGRVVYGISSKHVLSRISNLYPALTPEGKESFDMIGSQSRHLLKHIFPRQYGLNSAFEVVKIQWAPKIDFEDRELEIKKLGHIKTPGRLKVILPLMEKLLKFYSKCKFRKILNRHCPSRITHERLSEADKSAILELMTEDGDVSMQARTQLSKADVSIALSSHPSQVVQHGASQAAAKFREKPKFTEYLSTPYEVENYVIAIVNEIIPRDFWGSESNSKLIINHVKSFLRLRRYETFSIHTLLQNFCVADCDWLRPSSASKKSNFYQKPNQVEMAKRRELLQEFLYWVVDGFIMNIVKTAFSVTESAAYRNRTLYFRQDDWNVICRPILDTFGHTIFKKIPRDHVDDILENRTLGFSYVRLLPKETGVRPIVNLRRRAMITGPRGLPELGRSINNVLENIYHTLSFEKTRRPELLGSSVMGPGEIYEKLKEFKAGLTLNGNCLPKVYLVKVDVRNCFDTIKQEKLLTIIDKILLEEDYRIQRYSHTFPAAGRISKKFSRSAYPEEEHSTFPDLAARLSSTLRHAVFTDNVTYPRENRDMMLTLLREHITGNMVKIGEEFFQQVDGIPQGSVLSGLLCSLFYGDMEKTCLPFTNDPSATLFRYIDDFLFITTKKSLATKFLQVMDAGLPEYGCFVSAEKCLTNFDISLDGAVTLPALKTDEFPWCGYVINSNTLELKADTNRYQDIEISDTLTVERYKKPGRAFLYKMLQSIKLRAHIIYNDTSHNSTRVVYLNIYQNFLLTALKFQSYIHEWNTKPNERPEFFLDVIEQVVQFAFVTMKNRALTKAARQAGAESEIYRSTVVWLGRHAFHRVLKKKPTLYSSVNKHLVQKIKDTGNILISRKMSKVILAPSNSFIEMPTWQKRK